MQFDRGYLSAYFVTDPDRMEAVLRTPLILITDKKISSVQEMLPVLETAVGQGKPILIIAEDVDGEALATLVVNKLRGTVQVLAVKAPGFGDRRKEMLQDIAVLTGGNVVSEESGLRIDSGDASLLGRTRRVVSGRKEATTLVEGGGTRRGSGPRRADSQQIAETPSPTGTARSSIARNDPGLGRDGRRPRPRPPWVRKTRRRGRLKGPSSEERFNRFIVGCVKRNEIRPRAKMVRFTYPTRHPVGSIRPPAVRGRNGGGVFRSSGVPC